MRNFSNSRHDKSIYLLILDAINKFDKFSHRYVKKNEIQSIVTKIKNFVTFEIVDIEVIESLRGCLTLLSLNKENENIMFGDISLSDIAYRALLFIAERNPLNENDVISLKKITLKNKIVVSTGHQFDINYLLSWHKKRIFRADIDFKNETILLNPITNEPFSKNDMRYIHTVLKLKGRPIPEKTLTYSDQQDGIVHFQRLEQEQILHRRQENVNKIIFFSGLPIMLYLLLLPVINFMMSKDSISFLKVYGDTHHSLSYKTLIFLLIPCLFSNSIVRYVDNLHRFLYRHNDDNILVQNNRQDMNFVM
ncbi:MAG: hypothetical protein Q8L78_02280 [Coxiellaceae bacterium]|nr:hypothetical protein [Coxiellaceae bacterium]